MRPRALESILSAAFSLGLASALPGAAAPVAAPAATPVVDVGADSPFLPPNSGASGTAVTDGAPIELHGIMNLPDGVRFSIYDPSKKSATWVRLNERGSPFLVRNYSVVDGSDQVKVEYQGSTLTLGLKAAKITAMTTMQPQGPGGLMGRGGGNAITNSVVVNPTPADEAARLQAVVDAVAARRAARNQATLQQQPGGVAPQNVTPAGAGQAGQTNLRPRQIQRMQQQSQQQK